jgi:hypothetical protein
MRKLFRQLRIRFRVESSRSRALVTEPNRLGNRLFLANVTMPRRGVERQPRHIGFLPGGAFDT